MENRVCQLKELGAWGECNHKCVNKDKLCTWYITRDELAVIKERRDENERMQRSVTRLPGYKNRGGR